MKPRLFEKLSSSFSDLPLRVKGFVVVAIPVCALLAAMVLLYQFEGQSRRAEAAVVNTFEVRAELRRTLTLLVNAETGIRGFLLTGRERFLEPYVAARAELGAPLAALQRMVASDPEATRYAGRIQALAATVLQLLEDLRQERAAGRASMALDQIERGKEQMDALRTEISAMQDY